jgi:hypothetical protein
MAPQIHLYGRLFFFGGNRRDISLPERDEGPSGRGLDRVAALVGARVPQGVAGDSPGLDWGKMWLWIP